MCVLSSHDPPEKQSQLGSILQSQSVGAPEIMEISPLVDTCGAFKTKMVYTVKKHTLFAGYHIYNVSVMTVFQPS